MKVFILEDDPTRIFQLLRALPLVADVCITTSAEAALDRLKQWEQFDLMFLDHDLGGQVYVDSDERNTGYQVAKWIANEEIECPAIFIHTMNPAGAERMLSVLPHAKCIPYPKLIELFSAEALIERIRREKAKE